MSHFTVAVFSNKDGSSVEELLAKYDENIVVEPYVEYTREQLIAKERKDMLDYQAGTYAEYLRNPEEYLERYCRGDRENQHYKYLSEEFPKRLDWSDGELYLHGIRYYEADRIGENGEVYSTYNPDSKWDWYVVGGRFSGMLLRKSTNSAESDWVDEAFAADIDFEKMRREAKKELTPYNEYLENSFYSKEYLLRRYPDEATYEKRMTNFSTYAVVTPDGKWHAPGEMGWFGCSTESDDEDAVWHDTYYERFIKPAIENGWYLTIVDCHI